MKTTHAPALVRSWYPQNPIVKTFKSEAAALYDWLEGRPTAAMTAIFPGGYDDREEAYVSIGLSETVTAGELVSVWSPIIRHTIHAGHKTAFLLTTNPQGSPADAAKYARRNPLLDAAIRWNGGCEWARPDYDELAETLRY